jgi:hypothetical protein
MTTSYTVFQTSSTPASPGLNVPTPAQPLPGIPPNMSVLAAMSAGLIPANILQTSMGTVDPRNGRTVLESMGAGQGKGSGQSAANPYGFPNGSVTGGNSFGAGGMDQTQANGSGESTVLIGAAQGTQATVNGGLNPPAAANSPDLTYSSPVVFQG